MNTETAQTTDHFLNSFYDLHTAIWRNTSHIDMAQPSMN